MLYFTHKKDTYMLSELTQPFSKSSYDIIGIFKVKTFIVNSKDDKKIKIDTMKAIEEERQIYDSGKDLLNEYEFVDYFYNGLDNEQELIENAKMYLK